MLRAMPMKDLAAYAGAIDVEFEELPELPEAS
jgi:hypothetical protein